MNWSPPQLREVRVVVTEPVVTKEPSAFVRGMLKADATAVVERHAEVRVIPLDDVTFDEATVFVHAFHEKDHCDVRAARVADGWLVDVRREDGGKGERAWARPGCHLCLGKALPADGRETPMSEARIRPYRLPLELSEGATAVVDYVDYYREDAETGDLHCFAHRVVSIRSMST